MDKIKASVAKNIAEHRKRLKLTQLQLADKLNYSDKAVSKWERGEAVPDVYILRELANLFGITVDELIGNVKHPTAKKEIRLNKIVISLLSVGVVWLVATIVFVILNWCEVPLKNWMAFIYALPVSAIVGIVFSMLWGKRPIPTILVSALIWTAALSVFLSFPFPATKIWLIFIVAIPLQTLTILWPFRKRVITPFSRKNPTKEKKNDD